uniref:Secreted protein n=1 Tax=Anguilla anguilla TaxID=7936 RepID=A0A0E9VJ30_ANGAN
MVRSKFVATLALAVHLTVVSQNLSCRLKISFYPFQVIRKPLASFRIFLFVTFDNCTPPRGYPKTASPLSRLQN